MRFRFSAILFFISVLGILVSTAQTLDTLRYDSLMTRLANRDTTGRWPVKTAAYPLPGAILPFKRVVAYYGNM